MEIAVLVLRCPCGTETRGNAGDVLRCSSCGHAFDTREEALAFEAIARSTRKRHKLITRMGTGVVGLSALGGLYLFPFYGLLIFGAIAAVVWYALFTPFMKRYLARSASKKFVATLPPETE
jgi:hypothetical protein